MAILKRKTTESKPFKPQIIASIHARSEAFIIPNATAANLASNYHPRRGDLVVPEVVIELPGIGRRAVEQGDIHDAIWELSNVVGQMTTALKLQHRLEDAAASERTWDGIDHNLRTDAKGG